MGVGVVVGVGVDADVVAVVVSFSTGAPFAVGRAFGGVMSARQR